LKNVIRVSNLPSECNGHDAVIYASITDLIVAIIEFYFHLLIDFNHILRLITSSLQNVYVRKKSVSLWERWCKKPCSKYAEFGMVIDHQYFHHHHRI